MANESPWHLAKAKTKDYLTEKKAPLWTPFPGPQTLAYETTADELFYGEAAGGGKTDLLLGLAFCSAKRSVIYRRETKQFAAIVDRSRALASSAKGWKFKANDATWRGPGGRVIEFGGAQFEWDWTRHQGKPHDLIGWDELPHFTRFQFRVLN